MFWKEVSLCLLSTWEMQFLKMSTKIWSTHHSHPWQFANAHTSIKQHPTSHTNFLFKILANLWIPPCEVIISNHQYVGVCSNVTYFSFLKRTFHLGFDISIFFARFLKWGLEAPHIICAHSCYCRHYKSIVFFSLIVFLPI